MMENETDQIDIVIAERLKALRGGRGLTLDNHPASIQDRDGAPPLMRASRCRWPFVQLAFMDSGYAGERVTHATAIRVEIVRKPKETSAKRLADRA